MKRKVVTPGLFDNEHHTDDGEGKPAWIPAPRVSKTTTGNDSRRPIYSEEELIPDPGDNFNPPLPRPTRHRPGSEEKIRVLEHRAMSRLALWHPDDPVAVNSYFGVQQLLDLLQEDTPDW